MLLKTQPAKYTHIYKLGCFVRGHGIWAELDWPCLIHVHFPPCLENISSVEAGRPCDWQDDRTSFTRVKTWWRRGRLMHAPWIVWNVVCARVWCTHVTFVCKSPAHSTPPPTSALQTVSATLRGHLYSPNQLATPQTRVYTYAHALCINLQGTTWEKGCME